MEYLSEPYLCIEMGIILCIDCVILRFILKKMTLLSLHTFFLHMSVLVTFFCCYTNTCKGVGQTGIVVVAVKNVNVLKLVVTNICSYIYW